MGGFLFGAVALVCVTVLLLLRPWQRLRADDPSPLREINAGIYRDQLAELDRDLAAGTIAAPDHAQARVELQRRLLEDSARAEPLAAQPARSPTTALVLAVALPLLATGLYAWLGTPQALLPGVAAPQRQVSAQEIDQMLATLAARLAKQPDDPKGWTMLARSYRMLGRLGEAERAYAHIGPGLQRDPDLLAEYADVLAANAGGDLDGRPMELVNAALALDPDNGMALALAATAAYKHQDFPQAAKHWERLLAQLPPDSDDARWVVKTLGEIRSGHPGAVPGGAAPAAPATAAGSQPPAITAQASPAGGGSGASVSGRVSLAPALAAKTLPTDTVFVFARAAEGPRMPLAVQRARVADLPLDFRLDDSMAVSPQFKLSSVPRVRIEARISRSGDATPGPGDLIAEGEIVKDGASGVTLTIDRVRP